tara:strand:+ start:2357 stop:2884 length:528 start_codon:yes stop_codon:yes gene_type:complete
MEDLNFFDLIEDLNQEHKENLLWFWENKNKVLKWSDIRDSSETNSNFAKVLKGIYRPAGADYVLAIKNLIGSNYNSRESMSVFVDDGGGWYFEYPPEENPQGYESTNNGPLINSSARNFPVGFIYQVQKKPKIVLYKVFGPCLVRYQGQIDIFQLYGFNDDGNVRFLSSESLQKL